MSELIIPKPNNRTQLTMSDGAIMRLRQYGNQTKPRLVLCHGNGFARPLIGRSVYLVWWQVQCKDWLDAWRPTH